MAELKFRELRADELQVRPTDTQTKGRAELLIYKDSRCDMRILDETVGPFGWAKTFKELNGVTYCGVALQASDGTWIWKFDAGAETNFEKEKGTASDSFKRACFNWGIGRSLYSCPKVRIKCPDDWYYNDRLTMTFAVKEINYKDGKVTDLVIEDRKGDVVFNYKDGKQVPVQEKPKYSKDLDGLKAFCNAMWKGADENTRHIITAFFNGYSSKDEQLAKYGPERLWDFTLRDIKEDKKRVVQGYGADNNITWVLKRSGFDIKGVNG